MHGIRRSSVDLKAPGPEPAQYRDALEAAWLRGSLGSFFGIKFWVCDFSGLKSLDVYGFSLVGSRAYGFRIFLSFALWARPQSGDALVKPFPCSLGLRVSSVVLALSGLGLVN